MSKEKPTFQEVLLGLQEFWAKQGCIIWQPHHTEVGAGTFNPATFLKVLGPDPWKVAYVEPSIRPTDGRYGENPYRLGHYYQYQVILKPCPDNVQDLYLASLEHLGIDLAKHDVRFVEDDWESPTLGAWGLGWEVWIDGMECTQFTYFQQVGGIDLDPPSVELTYGTERLTMYLQGIDNVFDLEWVPGVTYGDVYKANEAQWSVYNFDLADIPLLQRPSPTTSGSASAAWRAGWPGRPTTSCSRPRTPSTCSTPGAPSASPSGPATSPGCATWPARWPRLTWPNSRWSRPARGAGGAVAAPAGAARRRRRRTAEGVDLAQGPERRDFLLEIGVEEMPASACRAAIDLLPDRVAGMFAAEGIAVDAATTSNVMVSPRRIAVLMRRRARRAGSAGDRPARPGLRGRLRRRGQAHQGLRGLRPGQGRRARPTWKCARRRAAGSSTT